jgi:DNA-binding NarL/FixJ family response regulator
MEYRIAIVEDDFFFNKLLSRHLENLTDEFSSSNLDFVIDSYTSPDTFLKSLRQKPDILILDYLFEVNHITSIQNASDLLRLFRQQFEDTPVLIVSCLQDPVKISNHLKAGTVEFISKDSDTLSVVRYMVKSLIRKDLEEQFLTKN